MFALSQEQEAIARTAREFGERKIAPLAAAWDEAEEFPRSVVAELGDLGFAGLLIPEEYGGAGLDRLTMAVALEELSRADMSLAATLAVQNMTASIIHRFGSEEQRRKWVPPLAGGQSLGAFALTEPGAGSDAASLETRAAREGSAYVLNGRKVFITTGGEAEIYTVMARTGPSGAEGISAFVVEKGTSGFSFGKLERKMAFNSSPTRELIFEDCRIPAENRLGQDGDGFKVAMTALDGGRINIGTLAVGLAQAALEAAARYANQRVQFGRPIAGFQAIQFMLADMATEIEASRLLVRRAAWMMDQGQPSVMEAAMAKRFATDMAMKVTTDAVQVFGGYGYMKDYPVERYMRLAKLGQIVEGTNQVQRLVITRELLRRL